MTTMADRKNLLHDEHTVLTALIEGIDDVALLKAALKAALGVPTHDDMYVLEAQEQGDAEYVYADGLGYIETGNLLKATSAALTEGQERVCVHCKGTFPVSGIDGHMRNTVLWCTNPFRAVLNRDQSLGWRCGACFEQLDQRL